MLFKWVPFPSPRPLGYDVAMILIETVSIANGLYKTFSRNGQLIRLRNPAGLCIFPVSM